MRTEEELDLLARLDDILQDIWLAQSVGLTSERNDYLRNAGQKVIDAKRMIQKEAQHG